jgi:hypothetical protein
VDQLTPSGAARSDASARETQAERAVGGKLYAELFGPPLLIPNPDAGEGEMPMKVNPEWGSAIDAELRASGERAAEDAHEACLPDRVPAYYTDPGSYRAQADEHAYHIGHTIGLIRRGFAALLEGYEDGAKMRADLRLDEKARDPRAALAAERGDRPAALPAAPVQAPRPADRRRA